MATEKQWMRTLTVRKRLADGFPNPTVPQPSANGYPKGGAFLIVTPQIPLDARRAVTETVTTIKRF
jgi:hypothetical protein